MITISEKQALQDNKVMKLFNEPEIRHHIGWLGGKELSLMLRKGENAVDYRYVLDAVPLDVS